jgi:predicted RND superfamily exporter protein
MLGEVFLLGHWKDYDELETSLSMPELAATLKAMYESERRRQKFMAALQGVDIDEKIDSEIDSDIDKIPTIEEIQARAVARLTGDHSAAQAISQGFTPDMGVSYAIAEGTDLG